MGEPQEGPRARRAAEEAVRRAPARVFLLDDHEVVRRGVSDLLEAEPDIGVVGEAVTCTQAPARVPALRHGAPVPGMEKPYEAIRRRYSTGSTGSASRRPACSAGREPVRNQGRSAQAGDPPAPWLRFRRGGTLKTGGADAPPFHGFEVAFFRA